MGGWDGEVEIKELKKKYFISLYLVQTWHENTHHARHNEAKTFYEITFEFSRHNFTRFFPRFFITMNEKALIEKKSREIKAL
jgi:hypothetical protein